MGTSKVRATQVVCDDCGAIQVVTDPLDIIGFSGTAVEQHENGGTGSVKWFACSAPCIRLAVVNAIAEVYEK